MTLVKDKGIGGKGEGKLTRKVINTLHVMAIHGANTKEAKMKVWCSKEIE